MIVVARKTDKQREAEAIAKNQFLVYKRHYRPSEKQYGSTLSFHKGFDTYEDAIRCVNSNPQIYFM